MIAIGIIAVLFGHVKTEQHAFMVWDANCIVELSKDRNTHFEAPMVNGQPDMKHGALYKPVLKLGTTCSHYEVRR